MSDAGKALINPEMIFTKAGLAAGMRVADFGCGRTGHFVFPIAKIVGDAGIVYAIDIIKDILESIRSRARTEGYINVEAVWSNIELYGKTPIPAASLDACFLVNVMFLLNNKYDAVKEAGRLLKSGGKLVVIDWERKLGPLGPAPELMVTAAKAENLGVSSGFSLLEKFAPGDYHYCLIFEKI